MRKSTKGIKTILTTTNNIGEVEIRKDIIGFASIHQFGSTSIVLGVSKRENKKRNEASNSLG